MFLSVLLYRGQLINMDRYERMIEKYLTGQLKSEEAKELKTWLKECDDNKALFDTYKNNWSPFSYQNKEVDKALKEAKAKVFSESKLRTIMLQSLKYAAVFVVAFFTCFMLVNNILIPNNNSICTVIAPRGEKTIIVLPDSSIVHLNAESSLQYNIDFHNKRDVKLIGEAYFDVTHNEDIAFNVHTSSYDIKVHGTRFNVMAYEDDITQTTLVEGSVSLVRYKQEFLLKPGQQACFEGCNLLVKQVDAHKTIAWKENEFIFEAITLSKLVRRLERWYDVEIALEDSSLNDVIYSGTFKNEETIWKILDVLSISANIKYKRTDFRKFNIKR